MSINTTSNFSARTALDGGLAVHGDRHLMPGTLEQSHGEALIDHAVFDQQNPQWTRDAMTLGDDRRAALGGRADPQARHDGIE